MGFVGIGALTARGIKAAPNRRAEASSSFEHRRRPDTLRTAIAMAFFWPTMTTSRFAARDASVEEITQQHRVVLCEDRDDHGGIFGALSQLGFPRAGRPTRR